MLIVNPARPPSRPPPFTRSSPNPICAALTTTPRGWVGWSDGVNIYLKIFAGLRPAPRWGYAPDPQGGWSDGGPGPGWVGGRTQIGTCPNGSTWANEANPVARHTLARAISERARASGHKKPYCRVVEVEYTDSRCSRNHTTDRGRTLDVDVYSCTRPPRAGQRSRVSSIRPFR